MFGKNLFDVYFLVLVLIFQFGSCPIHQHGGGGTYDLYCSQPPGGDPDVLASLLGTLMGFRWKEEDGISLFYALLYVGQLSLAVSRLPAWLAMLASFLLPLSCNYTLILMKRHNYTIIVFCCLMYYILLYVNYM